jgi:endonuclease/exonuclease/phosphatase family metal-dependent hydrolase
MQLQTVTWNIGGAKLLKDGENPDSMSSYTVDGLTQIADWLKNAKPDIIFLQEAHKNANYDQVETIARSIGYNYYFLDSFATSHIDSTYELGNGIISKHPMHNHHRELFYNPEIEFEYNGVPLRSHGHNKGCGTCVVDINDIEIQATTVHLYPFKMMGIDLSSIVAQKMLRDVSNKLTSEHEYNLIQGDFNIDDETILKYLPSLSGGKQTEAPILSPTTPDGKRYDHVLYKGLNLKTISIDATVKTDHFPVTCTFEFVE